MEILIVWLITALVILGGSYVLPWITVDSFWTALIVAIVLGLINGVVKPIIILLTLPINILTLGLFTLVINALMIMLAAWIVPGFETGGFWPALLLGVILSLVSMLFLD